jgi:hypothetical protein
MEYVSQQHPAKTLPIIISNNISVQHHTILVSTASAAVNHTDKNKGRPDWPQPHRYNHVDANSASPSAAGMFGRCFHASAKNSILDESALFKVGPSAYAITYITNGKLSRCEGTLS